MKIEIEILKTDQTTEKTRSVPKLIYWCNCKKAVDGYVEKIPARCLHQVYQNKYSDYVIFANEDGLMCKLQQKPIYTRPCWKCRYYKKRRMEKNK